MRNTVGLFGKADIIATLVEIVMVTQYQVIGDDIYSFFADYLLSRIANIVKFVQDSLKLLG